jgi:hypothetical protein
MLRDALVSKTKQRRQYFAQLLFPIQIAVYFYFLFKISILMHTINTPILYTFSTCTGTASTPFEVSSVIIHSFIKQQQFDSLSSSYYLNEVVVISVYNTIRRIEIEIEIEIGLN